MTPIDTVQSVAPAEAALIFGALVREGQISPLHAERLDTGKALLDAGKVRTLVVSNAERAAGVMQAYLLDAGVPADAIERDNTAFSTPDTCAREAARATSRPVIYVSQQFHLPRIGVHCAEFDLDAQFVRADAANRATPGLFTMIRVRGYRYLRETGLLWSAILGVYPGDRGFDPAQPES